MTLERVATTRPRSRGGVVVLACGLASLGCGSGGGTSQRSEPQSALLTPLAPQVYSLGLAAGAWNLWASDDGETVVAEIGQWRQPIWFGTSTEVPPVVLRLGLETGEREVLGQGWVVVGPHAGRDVVLLEERGEEYRYWLRNSATGAEAALSLAPDGVVPVFAGACSSAKRGVMLFEDRSRYGGASWLVSVEPRALATTVSEPFIARVTRTQRDGRVFGLACAREHEAAYLLVQDTEGMVVRAVDTETMKDVWVTPVCTGKAGARVPSFCGDATSGYVSVTMGDAELLVGLGSDEGGGVMQTSRATLRTADGGVLGQAPDANVCGVIGAVCPLADGAVAIGRSSAMRPAYWSLACVTTIGARGQHATLLDVSRAALGDRYHPIAAADPVAMVTSRERVIVASRWEAFAATLDTRLIKRWGANPPDGIAVKDVETTPPTWHAGDRPRVRAAHGLDR